MKSGFRAAALIAVLAFVESGYIRGGAPGFYCNDPKISFKYNGDTISVVTVLGGCFLIPLISMFIVETSMCLYENYYEVWILWQFVKKGAALAWHWYQEYIFGFYAVILITDTIKILVGEPRPHFLDTCKPDALSICNSTTHYISKFTCTNTAENPWRVRDSMRSFPSGHSSLSVYMSLFLMCFLRQRLLPDISHLLVPWLQVLLVIWALICSLTRITDNRHHWWDVLVGFLLGIVGAIYTVRVFCENFNLHTDCQASRVAKRVPPPSLLSGNVTASGPKQSTNLNGIPAVYGTNLVNENGPACLLSTTSSCPSSVNAEEREPREVSTS